MTAQTDVTVLSLRVEAKTFPPYDDFHGTPNPMQWRKVTIETPKGTAAFEQTDYGHAGRWNGWEPRGIPVALVPKLDALRALAEAAGAVL